MAGVYIEGIKMPVGEELLCLNIFPDGKVTNHFKLRCDGIARAFPIPDHGDLIDRDAFFSTCSELVDGYKHITDELVVIPAEEGE